MFAYISWLRGMGCELNAFMQNKTKFIVRTILGRNSNEIKPNI